MSDERSEFVERMEREIEEWKQKLDHLRVQSHLGRMETREKTEELKADLHRRLDHARKRLDKVRDATNERWFTLSQDLQHSWDGFQTKVREIFASDES